MWVRTLNLKHVVTSLRRLGGVCFNLLVSEPLLLGKSARINPFVNEAMPSFCRSSG